MIKYLLVCVLLISAIASKDCTKEDVIACYEGNNTRNLPECGSEEVPRIDPETCCFDCRLPEFDCTINDRTECDPPLCYSDEIAERDGCCASCIPDYPDRETCAERFCDTPRWCNNNNSKIERPNIDSETCCRTCRINPEDFPEGARPVNRVCTRKAHTVCKLLRPVCAFGERPMRENNTCCRSCRRPGEECTREARVMCRRASSICEPDEDRVHIEGSCCASCRRPRPECDAPCGAGKRCAYVSIAGVETRCRPIRKRDIYIRAKLTEDRATIRTFDKDDVREMIREFIVDFCSRPENEERCEVIEERLVDGDGLECTIEHKILGTKISLEYVVEDEESEKRAEDDATLALIIDSIEDDNYETFEEGSTDSTDSADSADSADASDSSDGEEEEMTGEDHSGEENEESDSNEDNKDSADFGNIVVISTLVSVIALL
eukprot:TRINITY_DN3504_c2_g1_i1.p1 TRINITY_DN3504_c2_g1~~TRINITY_DN3504_c2_g1_i1.p1  ORF type:complete len:436 (-),score=132.70 TRINITY_DN3504_c2_g1_i1:32-1339(-)